MQRLRREIRVKYNAPVNLDLMQRNVVAPRFIEGARFIEGDPLFIYRGHNKYVLSAAWSPGHGAYIASGDTAGIVQVWDAFTGSSIVSYHGHTRFVRSVAWSPDGRYIASGGDYGDSTAQVWQAFTGKQIYTHDQQYRIFSVAWAPDLSSPSINRGATTRGPTWIASSSFDGSVQVWQVPHANRSEHSSPPIYRGGLLIYRGRAKRSAYQFFAPAQGWAGHRLEA